MSAEHDALVEAWKSQRAEWLEGVDRPTVAVARSWFTAGWSDCGEWRKSQPITDERIAAAILTARTEALREAADIADDARFDGDGDPRQIRDRILARVTDMAQTEASND